MSDGALQTPIELVRKWHALAERRRNYFVELYRSERWRRYFAEDAFLILMRDSVQSVEIWATVLESSAAQAAKTAR